MYIFIKGVMFSAALIVAIGAQNAFVLKQGLLKKHVFVVVAICFVCDFVLMSFGVLGFAAVVRQYPYVTFVMAILGTLFLLTYAVKSFLSALKPAVLTVDELLNQKVPLQKTVLTTLAVTLLNPHVYLDTVVLLGTVSATLPAEHKILFLAGALTSSFSWFFCLGYGARFLLPLFRTPKTWKLLDGIMGLMMVWIALGLIRYAFLAYQTL